MHKRITAIWLCALLLLAPLLSVISVKPVKAVASEALKATIVPKPAGYTPTQIVNGDFSTHPGVPFKIGSKTYSTGIDAGVANSTKVSSVTFNGTGKGWNTTEQKIYYGSLFEYVSLTSSSTACAWSSYQTKFKTTYGSCVEMNSFVSGTLFQDLSTVGGDVIRWTLDHTARYPGGDTNQNMLVEIGAPVMSGSNIVYPTYKTSPDTEAGVTTSNKITPASSAVYRNTGVTNGALKCGYYKNGELDKLNVTQAESTKWYTCAGIYVVPEGQNVTRFAFQSLSNNPTAGNMLDNITFSTLIGNLSAKSYTNGNVIISGYWGETDTTKQLMITLDGVPFSVDMSNVVGNYFEIEIPASSVGIAAVATVYHQDYPTAAKEVEILRYTNFGSDSLNNIELSDEDNEAVSTAKRVVGMYDPDDPIKKESCSEIDIALNSGTETIKLYNLANVEYIEHHVDGIVIGKYNVTWNDTVMAWLETQRAKGKYTASAYSNPLSFASSTTESQRANFYKEMLSNSGNISDSLEEVSGGTIIEETKTYKNTNLPFGIYAAMASDVDELTYAPLVMSVIPVENGPSGNFYIKYTYEATLKDATASIDKHINGKDDDTVAIGDVVDFDIEVTLPIPKAKVTLNADGTPNSTPYRLEVTDAMNKAFVLKDSDESGELDSGDIKIYYTDGAEKVELAPYVVEYFELADTEYPDGTLITRENQKSFTYDSKNEELLNGYKAVAKEGPIYTIEEVNSVYGYDGSFAVRFNVPALKAWLKSEDTPASLGKVVISYKAIITDNIKVNSDANINEAMLYVEHDSPVSSAARAYTYALKLIKIDGSTAEDENPTRLPGAEFKIFKETDVFVKNEEGEYTWIGDTVGSEANTRVVSLEDAIEDSEENEEEGADGGEEGEAREGEAREAETREATPADFIGNQDFFIYEEENPIALSEEEEIVTAAFTKDENGALVPITITEEHNGEKLVHVYEVYTVNNRRSTTPYSFGGTFTTLDRENAEDLADIGTYTLPGLNVGNYVLEELSAPIGYNDLAEDILFSITKLDNDTAMTETYKAFKQLDGTINKSGTLEITVLNFKGLTLPSTGGTGTGLFVLVGIGLMIVAGVVLVVRRKSEEE